MLREQPLRSRLRTAQAGRGAKGAGWQPTHTGGSGGTSRSGTDRTIPSTLASLQFLCRKESSYLLLPLSARRSHRGGTAGFPGTLQMPADTVTASPGPGRTTYGV